MGEPSSSTVPSSSNKRSPAPPKKKKKRSSSLDVLGDKADDMSSPGNKKKKIKDKRSPSDNDMSSPKKKKNKKEKCSSSLDVDNTPSPRKKKTDKRSPSDDDMSSPNKKKNKKGNHPSPFEDIFVIEDILSSYKKACKGNRSSSFDEIRKSIKEVCKRVKKIQGMLLAEAFPFEEKDGEDNDKALELNGKCLEGRELQVTMATDRAESRVYSLKDDKFELMPPQYFQRNDNCWAVSHFRQWYVMVKRREASRPDLTEANPPVLTLDILQQGTSFRYQTEYGGIKKIEAMGDFMMRGKYVKDIKFHYKPQGVDSEEKNEEFERFLISLLRRDRAVAVLFRVYPSYRQNQTRIWTPTELERIGEDYERKGIMHNALLTGHGFCVSTGKAFWEIYESYGRNYGVNGFTRLAMHEGLILRATEMEV